MTSTSNVNVYNYFVDVCVNLLMGNIASLQTHNDTLNVFTDTNAALTSAWTTGPGSAAIQTAIGNIHNNGDMQNFINQWMGSGNPDALYQFSQAVGSQLMTLLSSSGVWDKDAGPGQMNIINQFATLITSTGTQEEQTGQNEGKTENSVLQTDAGAQQPIADVGNAASGIAANIASILQQAY